MPAHQNHHDSIDALSTHLRAHRVIASLNREQLDFLDKIGKDALFSSGVKLSRTEILSAMVNVLKRLPLSGEGVHSGRQFEEQVLRIIFKFKQRGGKYHG